MNRRSLLQAIPLVLASAWVAARPSFGQDNPKPASATVKDPVCGMNIDSAKAKGRTEHKGKNYYFCSDECKVKFDKDPAKYAEKEGNAR